MEIVSPKLVAEASELPSVILLLMAALAPVFWVLGWRVHRALFVAASTLVGGMYGLAHGPSFGMFPFLAAGLLSLSAGALALSILRIGVFVVFGALLDLAVNASIASQMEERSRGWVRVVAFLIGGLASLVCYRLLIIVVTSFSGALLLVLGAMGFAARQGEIDSVRLADERSGLITATVVVLAIVGTAGQYLLEMHRSREKRERGRDPAGDFLRKVLKSKPTS